MSPFKIIALIAGGCVLITLLFPPFHSVYARGYTENAGYGFILSPPVDGAKIDIAVLLVEWLGIIMISALAAVMLASRRPMMISDNNQPATIDPKPSMERKPDLYGRIGRTMLKHCFKLGIFIVVSAVATGVIFLTGKFIVHELLQIPADDNSRSGAIFEMVVLPVLIVIFFRKIVLNRSAQTQAVGLGFYLACIIAAILMVAFNQPDLAPPFEWLGLIGMVMYFAITPFKKSMSDKEKEDAF